MKSDLQLLLRAIDEGYKARAWHGTNLRGSIRGLSPKEAAWRPGKNRHNIWEIVVHCAYWKYIVRRRILSEKRGSFPLEGSNWFPRPLRANVSSWNEDIELLASMHEMLVESVAGLRASDLRIVPGGSRVDNRAIISGIAMHDVYHAGQIQLLKRLQR